MIDIGTVLNKLNDTVDENSSEVKVFGLQVLTADGSVREMNCRKNVISPRVGLKLGKTQERGRVNYNLKMSGLVMVHDVEVNAPRSIKAAGILQFKDFKQNSWQDVKH